MLSTMFRTLLLFTVIIIGGSIVEFIKCTSESMPIYMFNIILISMVTVLWVFVIRLIKSNGGI